MKLTILLLEVLNEVSIDQLQQQFVDTNKISVKNFDNIKQSTNKGAYATWLIKKVIDNIIKSEDIYKFKKYFNIFDKYKNQFPLKDINQYKSKEDVKNFLSKVIEIENNVSSITGAEETSKSSNNLISLRGVKELENAGIEFLGLVDGYQCFKIPKNLSGNEQAWKIYRKHLAKCAGRKEGEGIEICTMANQTHFDEYLTDGNLYVFFNLNDKNSPYQLHYESDSFMDKNDNEVYTW